MPVPKRSGPFWDAMAGRAPMPPAAAALGWELIAADTDAATIEVAFTAGPHLANPMGNVQGGFLAAMLDDTLGPALAATLDDGQFAVTLELKVSFLRPARLGRFVGRGRVVDRGGSVAFLEGSLTDADGTVVATATATARIIAIELPASELPASELPASELPASELPASELPASSSTTRDTSRTVSDARSEGADS
jgi:uncharacterized protein (TIGR00369 family)